ncbi:EthD domain-containing protein [Stigmatella sp. ncwal1]|uniref:EthD domain-containing protein n=1 Tax=Stigmatella ashevillensis TaxID=2995309 RepID=A0ABT5DI94_9BACT|nr:EthD domain-containing protein [Stigmatella ashevillena]MDC0713348.1 EthD domain-containing protein [Stigmatella ashevillena]
MLKVFSFLVRREGMTVQDFIDHYEKKHVPLVLSFVASPRVYKRNYLHRGHSFNREGAAIGFDVVTEQVFADRAALDAWVGALSAPGIGEQIVTDEERFLDRSRTLYYVIDERVTSG